MPTPEDILRDQTFQDANSLDARIYYTLTMDEKENQLSQELWLHRVTRAIAFLAIELKRQGILDDQAIDDWLFSVVHSPAGTRFESMLS
jgi:hypothetical protein